MRRASSYGKFRYIDETRQVKPALCGLGSPSRPSICHNGDMRTGCYHTGGSGRVDGKTQAGEARSATLIASPTRLVHVPCLTQSPRRDFGRQMDCTAPQQGASQVLKSGPTLCLHAHDAQALREHIARIAKTVVDRFKQIEKLAEEPHNV